jgi:hypothetical protein
MIKSLHMKTLTKPLAKMPAGAMFLGGSRKPDTAIMQPIPDYVIPFLPIFQDCESGFSIFSKLQTKYDWVFGTLGYDCSEDLIVRVWISSGLQEIFQNASAVQERLDRLERSVREGTKSPSRAARELLGLYHDLSPRPSRGSGSPPVPDRQCAEPF